MRNKVINAARASSSWTAPTSGKPYTVDATGMFYVQFDDGIRGLSDTTEALAAGFVIDGEPQRVSLTNASLANGTWTSAEGITYHADAAGVIVVFEFDVAEATSAGFAA